MWPLAGRIDFSSHVLMTGTVAVAFCVSVFNRRSEVE